jgi:hypothetical protein
LSDKVIFAILGRNRRIEDMRRSPMAQSGKNL